MLAIRDEYRHPLAGGRPRCSTASTRVKTSRRGKEASASNRSVDRPSRAKVLIDHALGLCYTVPRKQRSGPVRAQSTEGRMLEFWHSTVDQRAMSCVRSDSLSAAFLVGVAGTRV